MSSNVLSVCPICESPHISVVWELPQFPFTEQFVDSHSLANLEVNDQILLICQYCTHVFLGKQYDPQRLYNSEYQTISSKSKAATDATQRLINFARQHIDFSKSTLFFDIGANDGSLLHQIREQGYSAQLVGLDPSFKDWDPRILGFTGFIENFDFSNLPSSGSLRVIFASHVLEHIANPKYFFQLLSDQMTTQDYLVLQFPAIEPIVHESRFDQIHHQHFHYFSWVSLLKALENTELQVVASGMDWDHYGAGNLILAKQSSTFDGRSVTRSPWNQPDLMPYSNMNLSIVRDSIGIYTDYQSAISRVLSSTSYLALGAGLMSPIIFYHLKESWSMCNGILDDDVSKQGRQYKGIPRLITPVPETLEGQTILISGSVSRQAGRALFNLASTRRARTILFPVLNA